MAIDDNTIYGLYGSQIKDLPDKINAVKGMAKVLTTADYNWPENDPDGIALWKLPKGMYYTGPNVKKYISTSRSVESSRTILIGAQNDTNSAIYLLADGNSSSYKFMERYIVNYTTGTEGAIYTYALTDKDIVDNLTSTDTTKALSANQGKVLKDFIGDLTTLTTTAKTSAVAAINELDSDLAGKQDTLTAGDGISIADESGSLVISATGSGGLDPNTTFWGQTASNGAVTGRITFGTNGYVNGTNSTVTVYADTAGGADPFEFSHTGFDVASKKITNLAAPTANGDAANKNYVDTAVAGAGTAAFTTNEWNALWA